MAMHGDTGSVGDGGFPTSALPEPNETNGFLTEHVSLLRDSLIRWTGRDIIAPGVPEQEAASWLYHAPFAVLSHNADEDPRFTYGNRTALELFELSWQQLTSLRSRLSAEPIAQQERVRLLHEVATKGVIQSYSGVRISRTGRRFLIRQATVWNLVDVEGRYRGQAAMFANWEALPPDSESGAQPAPPGGTRHPLGR
jgi:hypothetical protein